MRILDFAIGAGFALLVQHASIAEALSRTPPYSSWLDHIVASQRRLGIGRLSSLGNFQSEKGAARNASVHRDILEQSVINLFQAIKKSPPEQWGAANEFADMKEARELIPLHPFRHLPAIARGIPDGERARCDSVWLAALKDTYESMRPVIESSIADLAQYASEVKANAQNIHQQIEAIRQTGSQVSRHSLNEKMLDDRTDFLLAVRRKLRSMMQKDEESKTIAQEFQSHRLLVQMAPHYPDIDAECLSLRMWMSTSGAIDYLRYPRDKTQLEKEFRCHRAWKHAMHDVWKTFFTEKSFPEFFPPEGQTILDLATSTSKDETAVEQVGEGIYGINREMHDEVLVVPGRPSLEGIYGGEHGPLRWHKEACDLHKSLNGEISTEAAKSHPVYPLHPDSILAICGDPQKAVTQDMDGPNDLDQYLHSGESSMSNGEQSTTVEGNHEGTSETSRELNNEQSRGGIQVPYEGIDNGFHMPWNWNSESCDEPISPDDELLAEDVEDQSTHPQSSDLEQPFSTRVEEVLHEDVDEPEDPYEHLGRTCHGFGAEMSHSDTDRCASILQWYPGEAPRNQAKWSEIARPRFLESIRTQVLDHSDDRLEQVKKAEELILSDEYIKQTSRLYPQLSPKCLPAIREWQNSRRVWGETKLDDYGKECRLALVDVVGDIMKGIPRKEPIRFWDQTVSGTPH